MAIFNSYVKLPEGQWYDRKNESDFFTDEYLHLKDHI